MSQGRRSIRYFPSNPDSSGHNNNSFNTTDSLNRNASSLNQNYHSFNRTDLLIINHNYFGIHTSPNAMDVRLRAEMARGVPEIFSEAWVWLVKWEMLSKLTADRHIYRLFSAPPNPDSTLREATIHQRQGRLRRGLYGLSLGNSYGPPFERINA